MTGEEGHSFRLDAFPCALIVTDEQGTLLYSNQYFLNHFGYDLNGWLGLKISGVFSRAGNVMLDSYVMPLVLGQGHCEEIQLTVIDSNNDKTPVVVNACLHGMSRRLIYWSLQRAVERDRLYQELLDARGVLEEKTTELRSISSTDELSGLFNRRGLQRRAEIITHSSDMLQQPLSLLLIDIDYFKQINDDHGHITGDKIIKDVGRLLHSQARQSDVAARIGGDEFVLLLPDTHCDEALRVSERLRAYFDTIRVVGVGVDCGFSIGIGTACSGVKGGFDELFDTADKALYRAKGAGRGNTQTAYVEGNG